MMAAMIITSLLALAATIQSPPGTRIARCVIEARRSAGFIGPCAFVRERGGTFTISRPNGADLMGVSLITVAVVGRGVAEVRGLTTNGINSSWGRATRSRGDPACWIGNGFRICAY